MGALLSSSATPCLSLVISRIHSSLFLDWKHTVSSKFCDTQVPSISLCLCSLVMLAVFSRLRCNGHSLLLGSYLSRIGRIENPSCSPCEHSPRTSLISFCTVQLRTLCATHSLATLCLSILGSCLASGAPWSSAMPPSLGRGRVIKNNNKEAQEKLHM